MVFSIVFTNCHLPFFSEKVDLCLSLKNIKSFFKNPFIFSKKSLRVFPLTSDSHFSQKRNVLRHDYPKYHKEYFVI